MADTRPRRSHALILPALALALSVAGAGAQQAPPVPPSTVTTGALPSPAQAAVAQKIEPIVPPAVVAPIGRTRAGVATKTAPAKSAAKVTKPKLASAKRG